MDCRVFIWAYFHDLDKRISIWFINPWNNLHMQDARIPRRIGCVYAVRMSFVVVL